jgi:hypothetical protein
MPMSKESKVTIKIPRALYRKLREIIDGSGFDSVTDFIVFVLRDIASSPKAVRGPGYGSPEEGQLTAEETEQVRQRLRNLGYL